MCFHIQRVNPVVILPRPTEGSVRFKRWLSALLWHLATLVSFTDASQRMKHSRNDGFLQKFASLGVDVS